MENGINKTPKRRVRGKNFTEEDDKSLCKAWCFVSTDPVVGTSQKSDTFWERIVVEYNRDKAEGKNQKSLVNRWSTLSKAISKFRGVYNRIVHRRISGANDEDILQEAQALFKAENFKIFDRVSCWEILKNEPKFQIYCDGNSNSNTCEDATSVRPIGKGKEKRNRQMDETLKEMLLTVKESAKKRQRDSDHLFALMEQQLELQLIVARHDAIADEYLSLKRTKALQKAKGEVKHTVAVQIDDAVVQADIGCTESEL